MKTNRVAVAALIAVVAAPAAFAQEAVQWRVEDGGNGHWYGLSGLSEVRSWTAARSEAESRGGHLATLTSAEEDAWLRNTVGHPGLYGPWLGGYQDSASPDFSEPSGGWRWVTTEPWDWALWDRPGDAEPNNSAACGPENYLHLPWDVPGGRWNDIGEAGCGGPGLEGFYIEWSADCNGDGIVDYGQILDGTFEDANENGVPDCCDEGTPCDATNRYAVFLRPTDTVRIIGNTSIPQDHTMEWSGYVLDRRVVPGTLSSTDVRVWSEQDGLIEDKALGFLWSQGVWRHFGATNGVQCTPGNTHLLFGPTVTPIRIHVAVVRIGSIQTLYVNGVGVVSQSTCGNPLNGPSSNQSIGAFVYAGFPSVFNGAAPVAVDWLRVSNIARYEGDFTSPDQVEISPDEHTQLLVTFDGAEPWTDLSPASAVLVPGAQVPGGTIPMISTDCDGSGIPDQVEIASGVLDDANGDWMPDCCQTGSPCDTCDADLNDDGTVGGADISVLLGYWGLSGKNVVGDLTGDGTVNGADLSVLLGSWGPCK